jgi:sugar phosphate isomerase/epimerase
LIFTTIEHTMHLLAPLSLAHLTLLTTPPPAFIRAAHEAGFKHVGLRLLPVAPNAIEYALHKDASLLADTLAAIKDTGVTVFDLEIIRLNDAFDTAMDKGELQAFFEVGARIGAKAMLVANDDPNTAKTAARYARLCAASAPYGLTADIEPMPWTATKTLQDAARIIRDAGKPSNAGVLVDALHYARAANSLADIAGIPSEWLHYAQICDAPAVIPTTTEALIFDARSNRMLPGEGGIDLLGIWDNLPETLPMSFEIPNDTRVAEMGLTAWAKAARLAAEKVFA